MIEYLSARGERGSKLVYLALLEQAKNQVKSGGMDYYRNSERSPDNGCSRNVNASISY